VATTAGVSSTGDTYAGARGLDAMGGVGRNEP